MRQNPYILRGLLRPLRLTIGVVGMRNASTKRVKNSHAAAVEISSMMAGSPKDRRSLA